MLTLATRSISTAVEIVEWPAQSELRRVLANAGVPRVLLVEQGDAVPDWVGVDEAWAWADATDEDLDVVARSLLTKLDRLRDDTTIVRVGERTWQIAGRLFRLSPLSARLFIELVTARGTPVSHERLRAVGWNRRSVREHTVVDAVQRLRNQLVGTGLQIRSRRGVGFELA